MNKTLYTLREYFERNGITQTMIANKLGVSQSNIGMLLRGERVFGKNVARKWADAFGFDITFLLTGEGNLFPEDRQEGGDCSRVPVVPSAAMAGGLTGYDTPGVTPEDCEMAVCPIGGATMIIPITGESMSPEYPNGSRAAVKKIDEAAFIEYGRTYVLDTTNGVVIKIIAPGRDDTELKCISCNPDPMYAPFYVKRTDVRAMWRVLLCMALK